MSDTQARTPKPPDLGRRTLTPFGYAVCIAVPILIAALGFTYLHFHYNKEQLVSGTRLQLLTSDWKPGDEAMTDVVTGQLARDDSGCLQLQTKASGTVYLVWPADFEATVQRVGPTDQIKVYNPDRDIVARSSDTIQLGGGFSNVGSYAGQPCAPSSGQVFMVQSTPKVVAAEQPAE
jgi:hypothetical protein